MDDYIRALCASRLSVGDSWNLLALASKKELEEMKKARQSMNNLNDEPSNRHRDGYRVYMRPGNHPIDCIDVTLDEARQQAEELIDAYEGAYTGYAILEAEYDEDNQPVIMGPFVAVPAPRSAKLKPRRKAPGFTFWLMGLLAIVNLIGGILLLAHGAYIGLALMFSGALLALTTR